MDATPEHMADAGATARVQAALAPLALSPWDALAIGMPPSFIRPSNVVSLADWRRKRRAAR